MQNISKISASTNVRELENGGRKMSECLKELNGLYGMPYRKCYKDVENRLEEEMRERGMM
jgi:hypothetical protein